MVDKPSKIHFIGIGGVGMSGIALVAKSRGVAVSGSDMKESRATKRLVDAGVDVMIGHDAANLAARLAWRGKKDARLRRYAWQDDQLLDVGDHD